MRRSIYLLSLLSWLIMAYSPGAQIPNIRVSQPGSTDPEEVTLAINPQNSSNLAAGANINYYYYSLDGGQSWTEGRLSSSMGVWGDPCVRFDPAGNLYYAHLSNPVNGSWLDRIVVQKSIDGGQTWSDGVGVGLNPPKDQDKEWLAVDETGSPYWGNLYMAWTEFDSYGSPLPTDSSRILFSRSLDEGNTWSLPIKVSDREGDCLDGDNTVEGAVPAVGPEGQVYLSWSAPQGIYFDKSLDGGLTFGQDVLVTDQPGGWDFDVPGIYRANGLPITLCDISNSPYRGRIYVVWSDQRNGVDNTDIFLIYSDDEGSSWSSIRRVNNDTTARHQFFPWAVVDPATGYLYCVFYDRRNTAGNATEVFVARSVDGGETFENFLISETPFTPNSAVFFGDYINIDAREGLVYPIWMRMDNNLLSVWMAIIDDRPIAVRNQLTRQPLRGFMLKQNYPNPWNGQTRITYILEKAAPVSLELFDITGRKVRTLFKGTQGAGEHEVLVTATDLPSGIYLYKLQSDQQSATKRMLLVR